MQDLINREQMHTAWKGFQPETGRVRLTFETLYKITIPLRRR